MAVVKLAGRPTAETKSEYIERIFEILESFDYPNMVLEFDDQQVGQAMAGTINICWLCELSEMMCAIIIWSFTFNSQIIPQAARATKH